MMESEKIKQEIRDLEKIIDDGNSLIKKFPHDNLIRLSTQQAYYRKDLLIDMANFEGTQIEMTETAEVPVVSKEARVV